MKIANESANSNKLLKIKLYIRELYIKIGRERRFDKNLGRVTESMGIFLNIKNMKMHRKLLISYLIVVIIPVLFMLI